MSNDAQAYQHAMAEYEAGIAEEQSKYRLAKLAGDVAGMAHAGQAIAAYRSQATQFHNEAMSHAQSIQQPQGNKHGLSEYEVEIAINSFGPIKDKTGQWVDLTPDQKQRKYAENKAKLQHLRKTGEYRQTTDQTG